MYYEKLTALFSKEKLFSILRNPQQSPKETVLLLGIIILILLIIFTLVAIITAKPRGKSRGKVANIHKILLALEIVSVFAFVIFSCGLIYTSQPRFCGSCHGGSKEYLEWRTSSHKRFGCLACHQEPGILGFTKEKLARIDDYISTIKKSYFKIPYKTPIRARVSSSACARCHSVGKKSLVSHTIKVSHKEILSAGYKCVDCHNTVAHNNAVPQPQYPSMDKCIFCHNNKIASAKCRLCHVPDVGKKPRRVMDYPKVHLEPPYNCRGCHDITKCTECHGLEMPHPTDWDKKHPRDGFIDKKTCWRCHNTRFCRACHSKFPWPHPDDFPQIHGKASEQPESCGCHQREKFCPICHEGKK